MRVAALQSDIVWEDPAANFAHLEGWIKAAAGAGARLLVLPEMFACGFSMRTAKIAEPPGGPSSEFLLRQAADKGLWLAGSIPQLSATSEKPHNTLLLVGPHGERHEYNKIHPFTYAGEDRHYQAGKQFVTVEVEGLRLTLFV